MLVLEAYKEWKRQKVVSAWNRAQKTKGILNVYMQSVVLIFPGIDIKDDFKIFENGITVYYYRK